MYAKLVYSAGLTSVGNTRFSAGNMIRDIVRLCTSASPNVNNLVAFSNTSSVVVNTTPAGWTFLYSDFDGATLANANTDANSTPTGTNNYWAMTAPCLGPGANTIKYAKLTTTYRANINLGTGSSLGFSMTSASSISNTGTIIGEGFRVYQTVGTSGPTGTSASFELSGNGTYHLVATERHITIIKETVGVHAVWEHTISDYHTFYNITPVIHFVFKGTGFTYALAGTIGTDVTTTAPLAAPSSETINYIKCLHNITDVNTGTNYSALQLGRGQSQPYLSRNSDFTNMKTIATNGLARNLVVPIMYQLVRYGVPTCFVTDICDMYWTGGGLGTTGDTFNINGVVYTYFDCGTMGLAINVGPT
jgi:hypothetical protein